MQTSLNTTFPYSRFLILTFKYMMYVLSLYQEEIFINKRLLRNNAIHVNVCFD